MEFDNGIGNGYWKRIMEFEFGNGIGNGNWEWQLDNVIGT
jgi:hypothetical protein